MGRSRLLAALVLALCPALPAVRAQEPDPLALAAADLVDPELGSMARLEGVATALLALIDEAPERARALEWEAVLADLDAGFRARGRAPSFGTGLRYQAALAWRTAGDVARARALLEAARATLDDADEADEADPWAPWIWIELADLARFAASWSEAHACLERARTCLVPAGADPFVHHPAERGPALALATWFDVAGQFYHELGRAEIAAAHYAEGLSRAQALDDDALWWAFSDDQMRLTTALGRLSEVEELFRRARGDARWERGPPADRAKLEVQHARALLEREQRGDLARGGACEVLQRILAEDACYAHDALDAEILLATEALDAGEPERARAVLAAARERRARGGTGAEQASQEAFALEAVALRELRCSSAAGAGHPGLAQARATFDAFVEAWCATPELEGGVGFLQPAWRNQFLSQWLALTLHALGPRSGARAAAEDLLRIQACGSLTRALGAPAASLADVQARLLSGARGALVYVQGREGSLVLAVDAASADAFALAPAHELAAARRGLEEAALAAVAGTGTERLAPAVEQATRAFLPPGLWRRIAPWREILLVGGEGAGIFGFELLAPDGRALGRARAVSHLPSLPAALALVDRRRRRPAAGEVRWTLVAPAEAGPAPPFERFAPVPFEQEHWELVAGLHGRERATLLSGAAASGAALRSPAFGEADLASLVTHGLFDPARERPAGLLLAGGEALWCADVEALRSPAVVTLIACGAGRGGERRGDDGRTHLGASFLRAGAQAVVLGQADLDAELGHRLDEAFHARLARGDPPAEALRSARAASRDERTATQALLVRLVGIGWEPVVAAPPEPGGRGALAGWAALALGLLVLLACALRAAGAGGSARSRKGGRVTADR